MRRRMPLEAVSALVLDGKWLPRPETRGPIERSRANANSG
jgi:hypothetical protein